jgi:hypothetical protein
VGSVTIRFSELLKSSTSDERRREYRLHEQFPIKLALRYRKATKEDQAFYQTYKKQQDIAHMVQQSAQNVTQDLLQNTGASSNSKKRPSIPDQATDLEFRHVNAKQMFQTNSKRTGSKSNTEKLYRVWPHPDPVSGIEFLNKKQLEDECQKPSREWVQGGSGDYGSLYIEVLHCDNLPNMVCSLIYDIMKVG